MTEDHGFNRACPEGNLMLMDQDEPRIIEPQCPYCDDTTEIHSWRIFLEAVRDNWPALQMDWKDVLYSCREIRNGWKGRSGNVYYFQDCPNCKVKSLNRG
jgi:hypothetical protein